VPDLRHRVPVGTGGLDTDLGQVISLGQKIGSRLVALTVAELAAHAHSTDINHYHSIWTGGQIPVPELAISLEATR
jgi:microcystin-dependent protein